LEVDDEDDEAVAGDEFSDEFPEEQGLLLANNGSGMDGA
jgi:hypothetical protein